MNRKSDRDLLLLAEVQRRIMFRDFDDPSSMGQLSERGHILRRGNGGRIIRREVRDGVLRELHATKGWRERRIAPSLKRHAA